MSLALQDAVRAALQSLQVPYVLVEETEALSEQAWMRVKWRPAARRGARNSFWIQRFEVELVDVTVIESRQTLERQSQALAAVEQALRLLPYSLFLVQSEQKQVQDRLLGTVLFQTLVEED